MGQLKIAIYTVPSAEMRYDTLGDWLAGPDGELIIQISDAVPENERFLIALHELVEAELCRKNGITPDMVDQFDFAYKGDGEPGDDPDAPYREQHRQAMIVEHLVANFMGLTDYGKIE